MLNCSSNGKELYKREVHVCPVLKSRVSGWGRGSNRDKSLGVSVTANGMDCRWVLLRLFKHMRMNEDDFVIGYMRVALTERTSGGDCQ